MADKVGQTAKEVLLAHPKGFNGHIIDAYLADMAGQPYSSRPFRTENFARKNDASRNWRGLSPSMEIQETRAVDVSGFPWEKANQIGSATPERFGLNGWQIALDVPVQDDNVVLTPKEEDLFNQAKNGKYGLTIRPYFLHTDGTEWRQIKQPRMAVLKKVR